MSVRVLTWVWDHSASQSTDRLVLLALADSADDSGSCWPSVLTLARKAAVSRRTVQRSLRTLEDMGEVSSVKGGGTGSSRYRITLDPRVDSTQFAPRQGDTGDNVTQRQDDTPRQPVTGINGGKNGQGGGRQPVTGDKGDARTVKRASKNKNSPSIDTGFDEFWDAYPRRIGKAEALRKYQAAVHSGVTAAALLEAARRYALSARGTDPKFIAHPATWLHQGRWDDDLSPPKRPPGELPKLDPLASARW
jgi:DNA-binding transcriptional MocR family regulator